ncbi:hypothetical protein ES705_10429 [subsurface metagenome]
MVNPVSELVKIPVPLPSVVLISAVVGLEEVLQHTPRAVTVALPSLVIFPPLVAELRVTKLASVVITVVFPIIEIVHSSVCEPPSLSIAVTFII